jgi:hypothetical protein
MRSTYPLLREALREIAEGGDARAIAREALAGSYQPAAERSREDRAIDLQHTVAQAFGFSRRDLIVARQDQARNRARHLCMWLCRETLALSYPKLGALFGRHHSNVSLAVGNVAAYPEKYLRGCCDVRLRQLVLQIYERGGAASAVRVEAAPNAITIVHGGNHIDDRVDQLSI